MFSTDLKLDFAKMGGLVPAVFQHADTRDVIMVGFMDEAAWQRTLETGQVWLYRRTLGRVQIKGEEEGKYVHVRRITVDCDIDTVLLEVIPDAPVCHYGFDTCFIKPVPSATGK